MTEAPGTIDDYLADKDRDASRLFRRFEALVASCGPSEAAPSRTIVFFKRRRVFAGGFVRGKRLEIVIDLLRPVNHPCLIASFASTKRVTSHRLRITSGDQLDDSIVSLLREAYETVGPGTRSRATADDSRHSLGTDRPLDPR